jgi:IS5 family transposase
MSQQDFLAMESQLRKIHELSGDTALGKGGRPAFDVVPMFKVCVLKFLYNLSDDPAELFIRDRLSFQHFPGLTLSDRTPAEEDQERARQARERNEPRSSEDGVYADSAYIHPAEELRAWGYEPKLCEKGARNRPLTDGQKASNREKSRTRCRVEHLFGAMKSWARDEIMRCLGRARYQIGMRNRVYNVSRYVSLMGTR